MKITRQRLEEILKEEITAATEPQEDPWEKAHREREAEESGDLFGPGLRTVQIDEPELEEGVLDMLRDKFGAGAAEDEDSDEDLAAHDFLRSIKVDPSTKAAADNAHADPAYAARFANRANRGLEES
tara:strand:+ start:1453 stop:1833 length:381 start_codon:yes stop_codon:yes gene_type:complete